MNEFKKNKYKIIKNAVSKELCNFIYPHSILPVTIGTRYSIVTWFI